jgi:tetratricopeptide (TPR) repeat protein
MELSHAPVIIKEVKRCISANLLDSAEQFALFFISAMRNFSLDEQPKSVRDQYYQSLTEIYELIGDIAFQKKEIKRALNHYRLAIQQKRNLTGSGNSSQPLHQINIIMNEADAKLRFKECKCLAELKEIATALRELEAIPNKYRDLQSLLLMGSLYTESNLKRHAISAYKEALLLSPISIEIINQLIQFGCEFNEIMEVINESAEAHPEYLPIISKEKWFSTLILMLIQKKHLDFDKTYSNLLTLNTLFPRNIFITSVIALTAIDADQSENALSGFRKIRQIDSTVSDSMDIMAKLLYSKKEEVELSRLANEVIVNNPTKPHGYLAASWLCALKNDHDNASAFVDKVRPLIFFT